MKSLYEELGGTYRQVGDDLIPDIELSERNYEIGRYDLCILPKPAVISIQVSSSQHLYSACLTIASRDNG